MFLRNFPNPEFDSQTKQKLTNSQSKIKAFLNENFEDFSKKLFNEPSIVDPITEVYRIKEEYEKRKLLKDHDKETEKKIRVDKFLAPTKLWNRLYLVEGDCLHEGTEIKKYDKEKGIIDECLKNIIVGDFVLTHNSTLKQVSSISRSIKESVKIKTKYGEIVCSKEHRLYVYDKEQNIFEFIKVKNIDKSKHRLVKNRLADIVFLSKVENVEEKDNLKYPLTIFFENGIFDSSYEHCFIIFNFIKKQFVKKMAKDLTENDFVVVLNR